MNEQHCILDDHLISVLFFYASSERRDGSGVEHQQRVADLRVPLPYFGHGHAGQTVHDDVALNEWRSRDLAIGPALAALA